MQLNTRLSKRNSDPAPRAGAGLLPWVLSLCLASLLGCTNGLAPSRSKGNLNNLSGIVTQSTGPITINAILRNNLDPTATFDILGDNTNSIGTYCKASDGSSSNTGASTCTCVYTYTRADGSTESQEVATTYHEANLLRCLHNTIPSAVTTVNVKIHITSQNTFSNTLPFNFNTSSPTFDTTSSRNFARVIRYTCRDIVNVRNFFDPIVYDPVQSESSTNSYPLNFYTTNLGQSINAYAGGVAGLTAATGWDCPANPLNPPTDNALTIYSAAPLAGAPAASAKIISPTRSRGGSFDRETFYLSQQSGGVFNIPLNAYIAPTIISQASGDVPPLGYGASPISTGVPGYETCPDTSVTIPSGFHWVKVWLFRMALPQRKSLLSGAFQQLGNISCNPGLLPNSTYAAPYNSAFPDCSGAPSLDSGAAIVARFFEGSAMCVKLTPGTGGPQFPQYSPATQTDLWTPNGQDPIYSCGKNTTIDPTHICTTSAAGGGKGIGYDSSPLTAPIDNADFSRYDFLFVVTPATVMSKDMSDPTSSIHNQYTPYRFRADVDCGASDPDSSGCDFSRAFRNYGLKFHDVANAGDPPANDPNRPGVFPVCALQPN